MTATDDNDRTQMPGDQSGRMTSSDPTDGNALPPGTVLGEFEIKALIGAGGFGIVYLAYDRSLDRHVAIKEYMPSAFASRTGDASVVVKSSRNTETFEAGLRSFINEARFLAKFDHPSLVKVHRFWEANGTGYMVMPFYKGVTLKQACIEHLVQPDEPWLKNLLSQLLDALDVLHGAQCFHRDIAPDNILLLDDGRPLLLDFGAARHVIGDMTQALTVMLKPGYAPLEQYAETPSLKQGAWSDLYALAAVAYFVIAECPPPPSVARVLSDPMVPLEKSARGRYGAKFLRGIDAALAVKPGQRPQSIAEFRRTLGLDQAPGGQDAAIAVEEVAPEYVDRDLLQLQQRRRWLYGLSGVALIAVSSALLMLWQPWRTTEIGPKIDQSAGPPVSQPAEPAAPAEPSTRVEQSVEQPPLPQATTPPPPSSAQRFDPVRVLDAIYRGRDPERDVAVTLDKSVLRIKEDNLRFTLTASVPGYVYVLAVGTKGSDFYLLFPNADEPDNRIAANKAFVVPRLSPLPADGPPGTDHFVAIVSNTPRDFGVFGGRMTGTFVEFSLDVVAGIYRSNTDRGSLAGKVICKEQPCVESYGAAEFTVEEVIR
jgi:serine/threonine protein kinase